MATHNIKMRKKNGSAWDTLYPLTLASNVTATSGQTVQHELDTMFYKVATPTANGAMSKEDKIKLNGIEAGANKYIHPNDANTRHVTDAQIALWNDKYNKLEIDNKFNELHVGLDWKESVNTFADIATTYPNPIDGWTVNVKDTDITYRFTGTTWIQISANSIPLASQSVDGKMSKTDKRNLDNLVVKVTDLENDMASFSQGIAGNLSGIISRVGTVENGIKTVNQEITSLKTGKADNNHNHDSVYSKLSHTHNYAAANHNHNDDYLSINGGTLLGDLSVRKSSPSFTLMQGAGTVVGRIRANDTGSLVVSAGADKTIYLRPAGDTAGQVVITESGVTINGKAVSLAGHGNHVPTPESDTSTPRFLRNDNTWQRITSALIGAAPSAHSHDYASITNKPMGSEGQTQFFAGDDTSTMKNSYTLYEAIVVENGAELNEAKQKTISFADIFYTWGRFSHNSSVNQPANQSETQAWNYDSANDKVVCTVNSATHIGFVSKDKYDNYIHETTFKSADGDDDFIGVVIAFAKDENGREHTLTALRNRSGFPYWFIAYNYSRSDAWIITRKDRLANDDINGKQSNTPETGWKMVPNGTRVKIERKGNIVNAYASPFNTTAYDNASLLTVNLDSDPRLAIFKGACQYGYSCYSQNQTTFENIYFSGGLDNAIYDIQTGEAWSYNAGAWKKDTNKSLVKDIGIGRFAYNKYTKKMFYIKSAEEVINVSSSSASCALSSAVAVNGFTNGHFLFNNNGKLSAKAITASTIGAAATRHNHDDSYLKFDYTGNTQYARIISPKSDWLRVGKEGVGGLLPYRDNDNYLGTSSWRFKEIHGMTFFEGGSALSSKYAPYSHSHSSFVPLAGGTMTGPLKSSYTSGTYLSGNQGNALVSSMATAGSYVAMLRYPSINGYYTLAGYQGNMNLQYTAKSTVDAGTNAVTKSIVLMDESGNSSFPGSITANILKAKSSMTINGWDVVHKGNIEEAGLFRVTSAGTVAFNTDGDYRDYFNVGFTLDYSQYRPYLEWIEGWRTDSDRTYARIYLGHDSRLNDGTNQFLKSNDYEVGMDGTLKDISGRDVRTITTSGRYKGGSCVNAPTGSTWYFYDIEVHNASYRKITARSLFTEAEFTCTYNNGTWSSWQKIYNSATKPTAAEIGAAASNHTHPDNMSLKKYEISGLNDVNGIVNGQILATKDLVIINAAFASDILTLPVGFAPLEYDGSNLQFVNCFPVQYIGADRRFYNGTAKISVVSGRTQIDIIQEFGTDERVLGGHLAITYTRNQTYKLP